MSLVLVTILAYSVGIPAVVGLWFFKSLNRPLRTITVLFCVGTVTEVLATVFRNIFNNNLVVYNTYILVESFLVLLFIIQCSLRYKNIYKVSQLVIIVVGVLETVVNLKQFNSVVSVLESAAIIGGIVFLFFRVAFGQDIDRYVFYTAGVILFYFLSNAIYFILRKYLALESLIFVSWLHVWINAICNIIYAIILWKASRSKLLLSV